MKFIFIYCGDKKAAYLVDNFKGVVLDKEGLTFIFSDGQFTIEQVYSHKLYIEAILHALHEQAENSTLKITFFENSEEPTYMSKKYLMKIQEQPL